jgi:hypothetical protein
VSNKHDGRWTRTPPSGTGTVVTFVFTGKDLDVFLRENKKKLAKDQMTRVPTRAAQRIPTPNGPHWLVVGSPALWPEDVLKKNRTVWWSKTIDVPLLSIDPGKPDDEPAQDVPRTTPPTG